MKKLTNAPVNRKHEIQATKKIIVVIGAFLLCHLFGGLIGIIVKGGKFPLMTRLLFGNIIDVTVAINSSINIIIYAFFDPNFKKVFHELFISCKWGKKEKKSTILSTATVRKNQSTTNKMSLSIVKS